MIEQECKQCKRTFVSPKIEHLCAFCEIADNNRVYGWIAVVICIAIGLFLFVLR